MQKRAKLLISCLLLIAVLICISLTGCYDKREIDDLAYVVGIGFDKGKTNALRMTLQLAIPGALGGGGEGGGGGESDGATTLTTLEAPTIFSGLNMVNNYISKEISLSHAKIAVFSEELAKEGLIDYVHAMIRSRGFRENMYFVVTKGSAEEYLESVKPELEANPVKYYEMRQISYSYTGFTARTTLIDFYMKAANSGTQSIATLAAVNKNESMDDVTLEDSTYSEKGRSSPLEGDYKAGNLPRTGNVKSETMGLAVFDMSKMVGELDGEEATMHLMASGEYENSYITFPDPQESDKFIVLNVQQSRFPRNSVSMDGDTPKISVKLMLEADILSIQSGKNYEEASSIDIIEKSCEESLKESMHRYLKKTVEFNTDICGFGNKMRGRFLTWQEWNDFRWLEKYQNSVFDVQVDLKIRRPGLMIRTAPIYGEEGEAVDK